MTAKHINAVHHRAARRLEVDVLVRTRRHGQTVFSGAAERQPATIAKSAIVDHGQARHPRQIVGRRCGVDLQSPRAGYLSDNNQDNLFKLVVLAKRVFGSASPNVDPCQRVEVNGLCGARCQRAATVFPGPVELIGGNTTGRKPLRQSSSECSRRDWRTIVHRVLDRRLERQSDISCRAAIGHATYSTLEKWQRKKPPPPALFVAARILSRFTPKRLALGETACGVLPACVRV